MKKTKTPKEKTVKHIIENNWYMIKLLYKCAPAYIICDLLIRIVFFGGFYNIVMMVFGLRYMLNAVIDGASFGSLAWVLIAACLFDLFGNIMVNIFSNYVRPLSELKFEKFMYTMMYDKATTVDLACYDNAEYYNNFVWAASEGYSRALIVYQNFSTFIRSLFSSIALLAIISAALDQPFIALLSIVSFAVKFTLNLKRNKINFNQQVEAKPYLRRTDYSVRVYYLQQYAKELRLTKIGGMIIDSFYEAMAKLKKITVKYSFPLMVVDIVIRWADNLIENFAINAYCAYLVLVPKSIEAGDYLALSQASQNMQNQISNLFQSFPAFQENSLYIDKFRAFMEFEPTIYQDDDLKALDNEPKTLELRNVGFAYSGETKKTLDDVSMVIKPGEKIAIVGHNGAGKTTMIKLLMRLYDPSEGEIFYDGVNIKDYRLNDYRNMYGADRKSVV